MAPVVDREASLLGQVDAADPSRHGVTGVNGCRLPAHKAGQRENINTKTGKGEKPMSIEAQKHFWRG